MPSCYLKSDAVQEAKTVTRLIAAHSKVLAVASTHSNQHLSLAAA